MRTVETSESEMPRDIAQRMPKESFGTWVAAGLSFLIFCAAMSVIAAAPRKALLVSVDFPGGSAEVLGVDSKVRRVHVQPALHWEQGWPCWWYLRVDGLTPGENFSLRVNENLAPYRQRDVLSRSWSQPACAAVSADNVTWQQTNECWREKDGSVVYEIEAPGEQVWLAWGPPFLLSHAEDLLTRVASHCDETERFTLAKTRGDRQVPGIRIGGSTVEKPAKYGVWVQARQHAWEAGSSWVAQGFLEWVCSDEPAAVELRQLATIYFVPIMDVDRVTIGAGGKESVPRDHNRDWDNAPYYPAVAAAQRRLAEMYLAKQLDVFLDLHNPGANERQPYFFGPYRYDELAPLSKRNYQRWLDVSTESISGPLSLQPEYFITSYVKDDEELNRMSSNWVRNHTGPEMLAATLETAWNTPHSTQEGYQTVGRQLGEALGKYLQEDPRRALKP